MGTTTMEAATIDTTNPLLTGDVLDNCADVVELLGRLLATSKEEHDGQAVELVLGTVVHALRVESHRKLARLKARA